MSVHTRIGAAGSGDVYCMIEQPGERPFQFALNRRHLGLNLPAVKLRPVISQRQLEVPHRFGYSIELMIRISATIITFNEEDRIAEAIASLACCDEVIVVDSGSTDRTCEIARRLGARVFDR